MGGSLLPKRQLDGTAHLVLPITRISDGHSFELVFDGAHFCDSQALGPLMSKDRVTVKDFTATGYNDELAGADGSTRAFMVRD